MKEVKTQPKPVSQGPDYASLKRTQAGRAEAHKATVKAALAETKKSK